MWKQGPLLSGTFNWGAVVVEGRQGSGFQFADFRGDHAIVNGKRIESSQIAAYDNSIELPTFSTIKLLRVA